MPGEPLRILIVTPLPYPLVWGFAIRVHKLVEQLAERHRVTLLAYAEPEVAAEASTLRAMCAAVHVVRPPRPLGGKKRWEQLASLLSVGSFHGRISRSRGDPMQAVLDRLLAEHEFDIVQVEASQMCGFDFRSHPTVLLTEHNIEYELLKRVFHQERALARKLFNGLEYVKFQREERRCWERVTGCILTSAREEAILRRQLPAKPMAVVPNGVDVDYYRPSTVPPDRDNMVFTGLVGYRPNEDAVLYFAREVLPLILRERPKATFTIVGAGATDEVNRLVSPNVVVTGRVPDVRPYVERAAAFVVPLRMGSGTRLKVLEGLAQGKPMVSTTIGCEGINVRDGQHLLIADNAPAFARAVLRLLDDPNFGTNLGQAGRALVEREYAWAALARHLEGFYVEMLNRGRLSPNQRGPRSAGASASRQG